ncbi:hypothetical protein HYU11_04145 [Candidatus Woesearchaeota archaeon]|nr:hypothetical protein [Candidatus Woesearchaeota archaeon]
MEQHKHLPVHKTHKNIIIPAMMAVLLAIMIFNQAQISSLSSTISSKLAEAKNVAKPAAIQLTSITDKSCTDCFQIEGLIQNIKGLNVNVTSEKSIDYTSPEAQEIINKYGIKNVPTIVITGETEKLSLSGFNKENNAMVLGSVGPPYRDLAEQKIVGRITITYLNSKLCAKCSSMNSMATQMRAAGIGIYKENELDASSDQGAALAKKYNITKVPAMLLSSDASKYPIIAEVWDSIGTIEKDGTYVMREANPPYYELESGKTIGLASAIMLNDSKCGQCYNVTDHISILKLGFGIELDTQKTVDISSTEGKSLIRKYNITSVPTIILSDVEAYNNLNAPWTVVGTIESDGKYIFRKFDQWPGHPYKDLETGKVIENPAATQQ